MTAGDGLRRVEVLGLDVVAANLETAARAVVERALTGEGGYACLFNVHVAVETSRRDDVRRALTRAWAVFPDGWPIAALARAAEPAGGTAQRIPGPELMPRVLERGSGRGLRHFLLGGTEDTVARLEAGLRDRFPAAEVAGAFAPPFAPTAAEVDPRAVAAVQEAHPHVVWCALGAPKQELWMELNADALAPAVAVGVGAAFDFLAGTKERAPQWMQRGGLEWLHRLLSEPGRLGRRYAVTNTRFALLAARELRRRRR
jgi:N-acetylglucosaminyldiphosphoundecaprenol N-acetyl-beta-D-mannosaminyltransferase